MMPSLDVAYPVIRGRGRRGTVVSKINVDAADDQWIPCRDYTFEFGARTSPPFQVPSVNKTNL